MHFLILVLTLINLLPGNLQPVNSPDKKIKVNIDIKNSNGRYSSTGDIFLNVYYNHGNGFIPVFEHSKLGLSRADADFDHDLKFINVIKTETIHDRYEVKHGKRKFCQNTAVQSVFRFENVNKKPLNIIVRAYNNGVAFRYEFPGNSPENYSIKDEATEFTIPDGSKRWMQSFNGSYEDFYNFSMDGTAQNTSHEWGFPALYAISKAPVWVLLTEADLRKDNFASRLSNAANPTTYKVTVPFDANDGKQDDRAFHLPWVSPWRVLVVGQLSDIVASTLVEDVSLPNKIANTDFVIPGSVSWNYWAYNHGTKDFKRVCEYIDLAAKMHWPYTLFDWEWDQMSNGGNLEDAVKYASKNRIKPLMWYNSGGQGNTPVGRLLTHESRIKEFTWLNNLGIYGIKVDFFDDDKQKTIAYYIAILEDAAKYHLMVDFHGATLPRGWSRTYPNLMTTEAVYGAEWYNNDSVLTKKAAWHNTVLPFTRNVVGGMDYTPVTFSNSQHPHTTTYGHELALSVIFESGLQHFADRPSSYLNLPSAPKKFLENVPAAWDDTKLIDGYPGDHVIIARKKNDYWYVAGLNGTEKHKELILKFPFLKAGRHKLSLITDGKTGKSFGNKEITVDHSSFVKIDCLPKGGFVGYIE